MKNGARRGQRTPAARPNLVAVRLSSDCGGMRQSLAVCYMARRGNPNLKNRASILRSTRTTANRQRTSLVLGKRWRGDSGRDGVCMPPEDWYEPTEVGDGNYRIVVQPAGAGYVHVLTADDVRARLQKLPPGMLRRLEIVQLSRMTRKKRSFPCYGMQWGASVYLYPIDESLTETYTRPPKPAELREAAMFGAQWKQESLNLWALKWTWPAIRDYYLNNVLIHEVGHILDDRNCSHVDRERFAEWFAIEYGYKPSRADWVQRALRRTTRRHHSNGK
jgi:hypothetical protein